MNPHSRDKIKRSDFFLIINFLLLLLFSSLMFVVVLTNSIPDSTLGIPFGKSKLINRLFPEGFSFFIRDPHEPELIFAKLEGETLVPSELEERRFFSDYFGFSRRLRHVAFEKAAILRGLKHLEWQDCRFADIQCVERLTIASDVVNPLESPQICGEFFVLLRQPVPWAWAVRKLTPSMPIKIVKVHVTCSQI